MTRRAMRRTRELREQWLAGFTGEQAQTRFVGGASNRGSDYSGAADRWVCNRKKAYPSLEMAERVADRLNEQNATNPDREEFRDVVVAPYSCGRCGRWHLGR